MAGGVPVGVGYVDVRPDLKTFGQELRAGMSRDLARVGDDASRSLKASFAGAARATAATFGAAFAAVGIKDFLGGAIQAASSLSEAVNKVDVVFGTSAASVRAFADTASTSIGQSERQVLQATGTFGNLFTAMGFGTATAADMSIQLVKLASDLASFNDIDPTEALDALRSGLVGETEPLKRLGVNMNEATLKAKALELGLKTSGATLDPLVKAQAAYALILEQTSTAQGDFARTADGLANQQRSLTAQWEEARAEIGEGLLPLMVDLAGVINNTVLPAFKTLFLSEDADATGWAARLRDAIGDTVGFILGAMAELARGAANIVGTIDALTPGRFGKDLAADLRLGADAFDDARVRLHATTGELLLWNAATDDAASAQGRLAQVTRGYLPELKDLAAGTKEAAAADRERSKETRDAASAERDLEEARRDLAKLQREGAVDEEKIADARERLAEATRSLAAANRRLAQSQDDYNDAQNAFLLLPTDTNADKLRDATDGLADAQDSVASAAAREKDAQQDLAEAQAGDPDFNDKLADAKDRVADAQDKVAKTADKIAASAKTATGAQKSLNAELKITKDEIGEILGLARALDALPIDTVLSSGLFGGNIPAAGPVAPTAPAASPVNLFDVNAPTAPAPAPAPAPVEPSKTVNVYVSEPVQDPGLLGKAIAWLI